MKIAITYIVEADADLSRVLEAAEQTSEELIGQLEAVGIEATLEDDPSVEEVE